MPIDLFTDRISRTVTGLAFCLAILPATSNAFTQDDQRRRCLSALRVGNSECRAYYGLHAQATVQSKRGLSPRFRQTNRAIGLGEVIRAREGGSVSASRECAGPLGSTRPAGSARSPDAEQREVRCTASGTRAECALAAVH